MAQTDLTSLILMLQDLPGVGEATLARAIEKLIMAPNGAQRIEQLTPTDVAASLELPAPAMQALESEGQSRIARALEDARWLRRCGASLVTPWDATYPVKLLERMPTPPPAVTVNGRIDLYGEKLFAVANSNGAPDESLAACDVAAARLIQEGWTPVTGHNRTAYQRAALAAKRMGSPVAYVLDRGLLSAFSGDLSRELFPAARIWSPSFDPELDAALSAHPLRRPFTPTANRDRDQLIFVLADHIVVGWIVPGGQMENRVLEAVNRGVAISLAQPGSGSPKLREAGVG